MKTKLKDFLLYSMACIGAISLFLSAYQPQQTTSTVPESHVWEIITVQSFTDGYVNGRTQSIEEEYPVTINKITGEVRKYGSAYRNEFGYAVEMPREKK